MQNLPLSLSLQFSFLVWTQLHAYLHKCVLYLYLHLTQLSVYFHNTLQKLLFNYDN